jgi:hypothetical protein
MHKLARETASAPARSRDQVIEDLDLFAADYVAVSLLFNHSVVRHATPGRQIYRHAGVGCSDLECLA